MERSLKYLDFGGKHNLEWSLSSRIQNAGIGKNEPGASLRHGRMAQRAGRILSSAHRHEFFSNSSGLLAMPSVHVLED